MIHSSTTQRRNEMFTTDQSDEVFTREDMISANADFPELVQWLTTARPGDVLLDMVTVTCVA
jgi:hypothetical protein